MCVDDLTPEQVAALRLVDNKSAEDGASWDFDLYLKRDMEKFIKRQKRKEGVYGKDRTSSQRDQSKAV